MYNRYATDSSRSVTGLLITRKNIFHKENILHKVYFCISMFVEGLLPYEEIFPIGEILPD